MCAEPLSLDVDVRQHPVEPPRHIRTAADAVLEEIKTVVGMLRDPGDAHGAEPVGGLERLPDLITGLRATGFDVLEQQDGSSRPSSIWPPTASCRRHRVLLAAGGEALLSPRATSRLIHRIPSPPSPPPRELGLVTAREREILILVAHEISPDESGLLTVRRETGSSRRAERQRSPSRGLPAGAALPDHAGSGKGIPSSPASATH
ncbi:hypothetical protein [Catenuloplanes japonicus]|uniref:hypothetical protein n=1 Tax=Catenuloplanes japonicus TaxID=33876 RepID=UPI00052569B6|nr:hypothetical protein [Catenuloplanes japonicus]